ncbi:MAG: ketoacyl-ACP synthase III [Deltaproteobacteria bacterium]|nr:ketoacyl-ACP synthase III [Deltaproteobacteria bacterium]MBW2018596.1 ketoacyl-ACP synthase III [Deltaproteobacteria bacterium]MBW2073862.1 ketoacyl-ACP synthase III [Deltaproteobacteria bacterium]
MIGIKNIGVYIPGNKVSNATRLEKFDITEDFIEKKVGIHTLSRKEATEFASDLCVKSFDDLLARESSLDPGRIDCVCVCTQNGDYQLPHTSAVVQGKLNLHGDCAAFDISLGCSGYVYSLLVIKSFMEANDLNCGILFTSDPYSQILDPDNKNTELLFGDAATATLLAEDASLEIGKGVFYTDGRSHGALIKREGERLYMDGREIFNFILRHVPSNIKKCLKANGASMDDIDMFLFHQASKYVIDNLIKRMRLDSQKVPFAIKEYGNTVSSTIPIMLKQYLNYEQLNTFLLSGFGVGLGVASLVLGRK